MHYEEILPSGVRIIHTAAEHAEQLGELQKKVFPTLAAEELMRPEHYTKHLELFPEGQFVALDGERVVGMTTTMLYQYDLDHPHHHTFMEVVAEGWMTNHDPNGEWLYGLDIGTEAEYRGQGIARALYRARHSVAKRLGIKGQLTAGMMSGYGEIKEILTANQYLELVRLKKIYDPTVSMQMRVGFEIRGILPEYLTDPVCANYCALLVMETEKNV